MQAAVVAAAAVDPDERRARVLELGFPGMPPGLQELMRQLCLYLFLTDVDYILATLAAAVAQARPDFDPLWLMLVAPSSSGKGEALRLLSGVRDGSIDDVTVAGLLGTKKGGVPTGILASLNGKDALAVIADFSTLLGDLKLSGSAKGDVFNALRTIYDGDFRRDIHPAPVSWHGRLSLVAACTPAIDAYSAHADALGTRWLYFRMANRDPATKREVSKIVVHRGDIHARRDDACETATALIQEAQARVADAELPDELDDMICDVATLVAYGRASVPRDWKREVDGVVTVEDPGRIVGQLRLLALGLVALGLSDEVVRRIVRRAALSSMPQARARVLDVLARATEPMTEYRIAKQADLDLKVAQRALQDWELVHFVESSAVTGEKSQPATGWHLTEDGKSMGKAGTD